MSRIRVKGSCPEMIVRRAAFGLGYRYRLHRRDLPGTPDIVFERRRKVIFVHGCFWHQHPGCRKASIPKSNSAFWLNKLTGNVRRDHLAIQALNRAGWDVLVLWECKIDTTDIYILLKDYLR